ncbi:MAG: hypothetical protein PHD58_02790 [Anaerolineales bacterium]|nr:hypothetical protein [Anaerolineales bacterium]
MPPGRIDSPYRQQLLDALQYQGPAFDCGPYTAATVLNALLGIRLEAAQLSEEMNAVHWRGPLPIVRRIPNGATLPWGMADVFRSYGLKSSSGMFTARAHLLQRLPTPVVMIPIIASWRERWAHVMALVAWDALLGWGFANTQYNHHEVYWLGEEQFRRTWRASLHMLVQARLG